MDFEASQMGPHDIHSINQILICLEAQREWKVLSNIDSLEPIGSPFDQYTFINLPRTFENRSSLFRKPFSFFSSLTTTNQPTKEPIVTERRPSQKKSSTEKLPLFKLLFQRVWSTFPGLADAPTDTWIGVEELFVDFNRRNFSTSRERRQLTKRAVLSLGFTPLLSSYLGSVITFDEGDGAPMRISEEDYHFISQLPSLVLMLGQKIKLIAKSNDKYLIIYPNYERAEEANLDSSQFSLSWIKASLVERKQLFDSIESIELGSHLSLKQAKVSTIEKLIISQLAKNKELLQILKSTQLIPPFSKDVQEEMEKFSFNEQKLQQEWIIAGRKVSQAKAGYKKLIKKVVYEDGELEKIYKLVGNYDSIDKLSALDPMYEQAQTWILVWLASLLHFIFISWPEGNMICELLIKIHRMIPYELIKQSLKLINPSLAIRATMHLILGQPFGALSLFQRILDSIIRHEIQVFDKQIEALLQSDVLETVQQPTLNMLEIFQVLRDYVYLPSDQKRQIRMELDKSNEDIIIWVLKHSKQFDESQISAIQSSATNFYLGEGVASTNAFYNLIVLLRLVSLKRDREQLLEMVLEPKNPIIRTIRQVLDLYYPTIYQVALASDLSKKFGQTEAFLEDLVRLLVKRKEEEVTIPKLMKLLDQHKQSYWSFVNDLAKYGDLCHPLKDWIKDCFELVRFGLHTPAKPEPDRPKIDLQAILSNVSKPEILKEARALSSYKRFFKILNEILFRLIFLSSSVSMPNNFLAQAFQILVDRNQSGFGEYLYETNTKKRCPIPLNWAWWVSERELCGEGGKNLMEELVECEDFIKKSGEPPLNQLLVDSDFEEMEKARTFYFDELLSFLTDMRLGCGLESHG
ncbi:hypothetical protein O181_019786 [Austropuccinia psidii MF-1]|uniref:Uncharacterized protein n=1 Tax=Austropuccinia psidii MF-1 TaxID=1389203 RepID=A0A9Q3GU75_9BASI|nr:hypothetical protein [Austropuccinia psidii MF-1]